MLRNLAGTSPGPDVKRISLQQCQACRKRQLNSAQYLSRGLGHSAHRATGLCAPGGGMGWGTPGRLHAGVVRL